ncbi:hypothetical protein [Nocardia takedensis]|uniref:hypothetical protein n=1 Tax=Nocardia takedensis TaxID=259390 RepID=UPI00030EF7B9|nr:hypothetical protein [Nocardia takedensis]
MGSHRLLIILLTVIAVVVAVVFVVTVTRDEDSTPPHPDQSSAASSSSAVAGSGGSSSDMFGNRLDIPATETGTPAPQDPAARPDPAAPGYLNTPPVGLRWQRGWGGAALPVSASDGPATITDGIASGFARTPQGAVLSAADALGRVLAAPEQIWQQVVAERYHGGGEALVDRYARSRARTPDAARYVTVPDGVRVAPGYSPDYAVVEFAVRDQLGYRIARWPMTWFDGDWRVAVPADLEILWGPGTYVASLTGFSTAWRTGA